MAVEPVVTVFVQVWNTEHFVGECIESVLAQRDAPPFEVIIIDDGSSDGTPTILAALSDPRVRVLTHRPNRGAIATANAGYALARGEFVIRLDSDDRLDPEFLSKSVDMLRRHPECAFSYSDIRIIDRNGQVLAPSGNVKRGADASPVRDEFLALLLDNFVPAPTTLVRRSALQCALPVPASYRFLDWHVTTALAEGALAAFIDAPLADYRLHDTNMHRAMEQDRQGEATSLAILDRMFASPARALEKRHWRRRVYARHYAAHGDKYFGRGMTADARRCYLRAVRLRPALLGDAGIMRRLAATFVGRRVYAAAKAAARRGHAA